MFTLDGGSGILYDSLTCGNIDAWHLTRAKPELLRCSSSRGLDKQSCLSLAGLCGPPKNRHWCTSSAGNYDQASYEWISACSSFTSFYSDRAQSHETSQTQSPLKLHRAGLNPSKHTQYWNPGVWRTFILGHLSIDWIETSTLQFISFSFWITESISDRKSVV